jgi:large subunit ribosomal protein L28
MSRKCELTGKSPLKGHRVSHANNKTKRKFFPNLKNVTFKSDLLKRNVTLNVSNAALRSVDYKGGIDFYLKGVKAFKLSSKAKKLKNKIIAKT